MSKGIIKVDIKSTVGIAREQMVLGQQDYVFVVDKKKVVGLITKSDLLLEVDMVTPVTEVMVKEIISIRDNAPVAEAAKLLTQHHVEHLPVYDEENHLLGVVRSIDIIQDMVQEEEEQKAQFSPETGAINLSMTKSKEEEESAFQKVVDAGFKAAVTQVGCTAEKLPLKLREAAIVACIARKVIKEDSREKVAVSNAIRDVINQFNIVNPGLGGGFKIALVRGGGRIVVSIFGKSGHALANSPDQIFMASNII